MTTNAEYVRLFEAVKATAVFDRALGTVRLSKIEDEQGFVFLHTDIYKDGARLRWTADHPSGWSAGGFGVSVEDCEAQARARFAAALGLQVKLGADVLRRVV